MHCHTIYSGHSSIELTDVISKCKEKGIKVIAITDHNTIEGAILLKAKAPKSLFVIVGEEIRTAQGEITGLFLSKKIEPGQDILDTIKEIRAQGGLVLIPHPYDSLRHETIRREQIVKAADRADFIEVFNSRCLFNRFNKKAFALGKKHKILPIVGSDAHLPSEIGRSINLIEAFDSADTFLKNMKKAVFETKASGILVHLQTAILKRLHRSKNAY